MSESLYPTFPLLLHTVDVQIINMWLDQVLFANGMAICEF